MKGAASGAETCECNDCKNYVTHRDKIFPEEVLELFNQLGIDYKKEVEIISYETLSNGLHHIGGWFHFKGRLLGGKDYRVPFSSGAFTVDLTVIAEDFSIGFAEGNALTFFANKSGLVQIEFETKIPGGINKSLETS
jgi:hypothetical protein